MAKKKKLKDVVAAAGSNITKKEFDKILQAAGGDVAKSLNKIEKAGAGLNSGAANMLIKQAQSLPADPLTGLQFGTSNIGQTLQTMAGTAGQPGYMYQGQKVGQTPGTTGTGLMIGGTQIKPGGGVTIKKPEEAALPPYMPGGPMQGQPTPAGQGPGPLAPKPSDPANQPAPPKETDPMQAFYDSLSERMSGIETAFANQTQPDFQSLFAPFAQALQQQEARYQTGLQNAANEAAQRRAEQEATMRTFMINQGRTGQMANLQIGGRSMDPRLGGTQAFKGDPFPYQRQPQVLNI